MTRTPISAPPCGASRRTAKGDNDCVEVADGYAGIVPVRDSKTPASRPVVFSTASWSAFVRDVKETV
ncbi:DUF397 domain-containing protein [Streptomyces lasalocidi]